MSTHIKSIRIRNVRKLTVAECEFIPERGLVRITGANASGKTSLLREVAGLLCGASAVLPDAVQDGHDEGFSELVLTDGLTISRTYNETYPKGYLNVVGADGGTHKQGKLNGLVGPRVFDPFPFLDLKPAKMREALLSVATDPDLPKKLDKLKAKSDGIYAKRTPFIVKERADRAVSRPSGDRPEPIDVMSEMAKLQELQAAQAKREKCIDVANSCATDVEACGQQIEAKLSYIRSITAEIDALKVEQADAGEQHQGLLDEAMALPEVQDDILKVSERISESNAVSAQLIPWQMFDQAQDGWKEANVEVKALTKALEAVADEEKALLANSGIPVKDLSFSEEGVPLLNGHPLEVASGREKIDMVLDVAFAANPELRACLLDDANDLDLDSLEALNARAIEQDFQVLVTRVSEEGGSEITVEDGVAKSEAVAK